uniref:hypothetical protein n=1 Tax=Pseudonocardia sp. CA-138482 TaxID=3240023 RepID=UPI003F494031
MNTQVADVLAVLASAPDGEMAGEQISREAQIPGGSLAQVLTRMETWGLLTSSWEYPVARDGVRRRLWKITPLGKLQAQDLPSSSLVAVRQLSSSSEAFAAAESRGASRCRCGALGSQAPAPPADIRYWWPHNSAEPSPDVRAVVRYGLNPFLFCITREDQGLWLERGGISPQPWATIGQCWAEVEHMVIETKFVPPIRR